MIWGRMAVKHSNQGRENPGNRRQATPVWLRGWPLAIPSVGVAVLAASLAVPRATKPRTVPAPVLHVRDLSAEFSQLEQLAAAARSHPLPFAIRELGESYRRLGRTQFYGPQALDDSQALGWQSLIRATRTRFGDGPLLTLRAAQVQMFVESLKVWEETGRVPDDLAELGGDFTRLADKHQWHKSGHLQMQHEERWALGLLRWTTLAGLLKTQPYRLSRDMELVELRFFFAQNQREGAGIDLRQRILQRYSELEPEYPLEYAEGVLAAEAGQFDAAAAHFSRQLQAHPTGSYVTRARNHLIWVTQQLHMLDGDGDAQ